jgi:4-hydroxybenzoate polyprenyltransferase
MSSDAETNLSDEADVGDLHQFGYAQSLRRTLGPYGSFAIAFSMISITTAIFFLLPSLFGTAGAAGVWLWIPCAAECSSSCSCTHILVHAFLSPASPTNGTAA